MKKSALATALLAATAMACESDDTNSTEPDAPTACTRDFDCQVGEVCGAADADGNQVCEGAASATTPRLFGEANLTFDNDEAYLVTVYTLPIEEDVPADTSAFFTLDGLGPNANALRIEQPRPPKSNIADSEFWRSRLALDAKRREGMTAVGEAIARDELKVFPDVRRQFLRIPRQVGVDQLTLAIGESTITATLAATVEDAENGITLNLYVDDADTVPLSTVNDLGNEFLTAAAEVLYLYSLDTGHSGVLDRDGDGALAVVFSESIPVQFGAGIVGFFQFLDFLQEGSSADGFDATGNEQDIIWARAPTLGVTLDSCEMAGGCDPSEIPLELAVATLAHEYNHLVNFAVRASSGSTVNTMNRETLWLDEAISTTIEDLVGYGNSTQETVIALFDEWFIDGRWATEVDTVAQRGMSYTLLRHIIDQRAKSAGATDAGSMQTREAARAVLTELIGGNATGYLQPLFQNLGPQGIGDWLVGLYVTDNREVSESFDIGYLPVGQAPSTLPIGFSPFRDPLLTARGVELFTEGPPLGDDDTDIIDDLSTAVESEMTLSQAFYFVVEGPTEPTTLRATGDAGVDFHLRVDRIR